MTGEATTVGARWEDAVGRARLVAAYSPSYGRGIEEWQSLDLLALLLYAVAADTDVAVVRVDPDAVAAVLAPVESLWPPVDVSDQHDARELLEACTLERMAARQEAALAIQQALHERISALLRDTGHDVDEHPSADPVVRAWRPLDVVPADTAHSLSLHPEWLVHVRGTTPLGRAARAVLGWLDHHAQPRTGHRAGIIDFGTTAWSPPGPRPHIHVPVDDAVRALTAAYAPVLHAWRHLLTPVHPDYLHLTLAWHPAPADSITDDQRAQLAAALAAETVDFAPITLTIGRPMVTRGGVVLDVSPDDTPWPLAAAAYNALSALPGHATWPGSWQPHIAIAYANTPADGNAAHALAQDLRHHTFPDDPEHVIHRPSPVPLHVTELLIVDQDTYHPDGLHWTRAQRVPLGAGSRLRSPT